MTINIIDQIYIKWPDFKKNHLQCLGIAALNMAIKFDQSGKKGSNATKIHAEPVSATSQSTFLYSLVSQAVSHTIILDSQGFAKMVPNCHTSHIPDPPTLKIDPQTLL